ncbi:hypothetical protein HAX54_034558, partial [Datura stramonium]|nr:hypothetical protein [Datura stramonium]
SIGELYNEIRLGHCGVDGENGGSGRGAEWRKKDLRGDGKNGQNLPHHPYVPIEVTSVAIHQSLQNASNNRVFIETSKEKEKDKEIQDLYAICDSGYGFLIDELQDAIQSLAKRDYNALENALFKCPRFVSDCRNVLDSKITPEMLDRSRKQFDLVLMSQIAEGLIKQ